MKKPNEFRIIGPPGTGKTTTLSRLIAKSCSQHGSEAVLVTSFTKAAARELVSRNLPLNDDRIGTLHALCYRALDRPKIVDRELLKDWNSTYPSMQFGGIGTNLDDPYGDIDSSGAKDGDGLLQELNRLRGLQVPEDFWPIRIQNFKQYWSDFKDQTFTIDFTDLIARCLEERVAIPHDSRVMFLDEVQDFSPLELSLARWWGESCEELYLGGDDDQCHPADTLIRTTTRGDVSIAQLRQGDLLRTFDRTGGSEFYGTRRRGYTFTRGERQYAGLLHTFKTESGASLSVTHDHRMMVQWNSRAKGAVCVYAMRKGLSWRVGTSEVVRRQSGIFGPTQRARQEGADSTWILKIFDTVSEARLYEDFVAARYGLSRLVFNAAYLHDIAHTQCALDLHHWTMISAGRIRELFRDHALSLQHPYWASTQGQSGRGCGALQIVRAVNCFPRYMQMVRDVGIARGVKDCIVEIQKTPYDGTVYSLDVPPYHMYVANGIATPNCLYRFKGATPEAFLTPELPPDHVQVLAQSYRVPAAVHAAASAWIEGVNTRAAKDYRPRPFPGLVDQLGITYKWTDPLRERLMEWIDAGKTVALLASCSFFIDPLKHKLREWGIPFHNPYRRTRGDWNPLTGRSGTVSASDRVRMYRKPVDESGWWTYRELWEWAGCLKAEDIFHRGAKTLMRRKAEGEETAGLAVEVDDLEKWFADPVAAEKATAGDVVWLQSNLLDTYRKPIGYACNILEARGAKALKEQPKIILGTIHSVKGGEADIVVLFPDLSPAGYQEWTTPGEARDSVRRMFYVGQTRAREELYWAQPVGPSISGYL